MTENDFLALSRAGFNRIPLTLETLADLDTPLSLYLKLANAPGTYLLESVIGGERFGRYSIIGLAARERIEVAGGRGRVIRDGKVVQERDAGDPLAFVDEYLKGVAAAPLQSSLRFAGGLAGYFSYDTVRYIEPKLAKDARPDPIGLPDVRLLLSEELAVVDNLAGKVHLIVYADAREPDAYAKARSRLETLRGKLRGAASLPEHVPVAQPQQPRSNIGEQPFYAA